MEAIEQLETGSFSKANGTITRPDELKVVSWNINRGQHLHGIIEFLSQAAGDLILLQEADRNARRTHGVNVAREIARALEMNYVFGCEFQELTQSRKGEPAYHGQATLSRFPLTNSRIIRFQHQSDFWRPQWFIPRLPYFQRRLGGRMALVSYLPLSDGNLVLYNIHLESRGDLTLRCNQLYEIHEDLCRYPVDTPAIVVGDFNFSLCSKQERRLIQSRKFNNPFDQPCCSPSDGSLVNAASSIDWILTKGPLTASDPKVHRSVRVSDHFPLTLTVRRDSHFVNSEGS